jgi:hypothetical protein|tara:strand:- start:5556 stop:6407 length:852 start_codon:yes stop_codon:yes gene_type:complete
LATYLATEKSYIILTDGKGKDVMNKLLTTTAVAVLLAGTAHAEGLVSGSIETVIAESANDKYGATTSFDIDVNAPDGIATGSMSFKVDGANDLALDEWHIGTTAGATALSFGKQGNIWVDTESSAVNGTLEEPTMATESLQVSAMGATVALGFDDVKTDVTDLENVQVSYAMGVSILNVATAYDYNIDSKEWVLAGRADTAGMLEGVRLGGAVSYGSLSEQTNFEVDATVMGITSYMNGDVDDLTQNVGGSYTIGEQLTLEGAVNYNLNTEVVAPSVTLSFNF